ncbi:MAG: phenylacetate--CoA ligase [Methanothrix soehngenii]|jgi:phenylacetate-CoA ligase|uniref:phenylacetate--CoA ligase family protein n=1 Tax=Methanothrix soehngenii TaxID=2223 RepID=UPI0023EFBECF|nr:phenylacetate--CoA ligase [Methanothrix soehngenii]MCK9586088.1 phenylacetate--CoA ligase [Methanothrix soehngenii]MDD3975343.1 phenylacetate--CoA ligase [Methanothrix soehngenii]MDD4488714.1 phenylacetate--CoA ligase [Methanothrix soehngenii]MDD5256086.1 phenylacetate--CoA ligase [Methanothrix soehngenii]MDD5735061.1 phenylacetate--CoA ligase [Methanothrix soehngenii]
MTQKGNFHNESMETASRESIHELQSRRLRAIVGHVYESNAIYRRLFDEKGIRPEDIRTAEDVVRLPFTGKDILRESYPLKMACVPRDQIVEMHMSSGSTGTPVVMPYTRSDLDQWAECMARCYRMSGAKPGDATQITPLFGLFNGGFGMYHGARAAGLFVIPAGPGNTARQIRLARDLKTRVFTGVVSYGIRLMEVLAEEKESLPELEIGIFGAEVFSDSMKKKISSGLDIDVFDIYGMTESGGVGTLGMDCPAHDGIHVWEDQYILEVIDPKTGEPVDDGEEGELVFTSLTRQALPMIRFRTADLTHVISRDRCECGRTHVRLAPITGRRDDMLIVKGVNFFPKQIEQTLLGIPGIGNNYQIIVEEIDGVNSVRVNVEADPGVTGYMVEKALKEALGFSPKGDVFPLGGLPRQEGKAKRVFHNRIK